MSTEFFKFSSLKEANDFIIHIDNFYNYEDGQTFTEPMTHPFDGSAIVETNFQINHDFSKYIEENNLIRISDFDAMKNGYIRHYHKGKFGKARGKLEEVQFVNDSFIEYYGKENFIVMKGLFFSFLGGLYSMKESVKKVCYGLKGSSEQWYKEKLLEMKNDPLLNYYHEIYNSDKHDLQVYLVSNMVFNSWLVPKLPFPVDNYIFNSEGAFAIINSGTSKQRRVPVGALGATFYLSLYNAPNSHLGQDITNQSVLDLNQHVLNYHEEFLFEAEAKFG
jgi:hypothetical protein